MSEKQMFSPWLGDALVVVDVQKDFLPGGALPIADGERIIPILNACLRLFVQRNLPVFAIRHWHPPDHAAFQRQGGAWPEHCVAGTPGAEFPPTLALPPDTVVVSRARAEPPGGAAVFGETVLALDLHRRHVRRIFVGGLGTEDGVRSAALDALNQGLGVVLLEDAVCAVDQAPGDGLAVIEALREDGVELATLAGGQS